MTTQPVRAGRRYKRALLAVFTVGAVGLLVGSQTGYYVAGLAVYAVATVAGFALYFYVRYDDSVAMQDEREAELERRASHLTVQVIAYVGVFASIALFAFDAAGRPSLGPAVETLMNGFVAFGLTWAAAYLWLRYRP